MHWEGHVGAALVAYAPIGGILVAIGATGPAVGGAVAFGWLCSRTGTNGSRSSTTEV